MERQRTCAELYRDIVREHARAPAGAGRLDGESLGATASNANCGDRVELTVRLGSRGTIGALRHVTEGCLLCKASASLMAIHAVGLDAAGLRGLHGRLRAYLTGRDDPCIPVPLLALGGVAAFPSRLSCVLLPWEAALRTVRSEGDDELRHG